MGGCYSAKGSKQAATNQPGGAKPNKQDDKALLPATDKLMACAKREEPTVTPVLKSIAAKHNGELSGLPFRFKSKDSMLRKSRSRIDRQRLDAINEGKEIAVDIPKLVWTTTDALRYTVLLPTDTYTTGVKEAMAEFKNIGMEAKELKNFWPGGDNYQGINDVFGIRTSNSPSGWLLFEVQFHTPESFDSKMNSHHFYETFRTTHDPDEKIKNWQELCASAQRVPVPKDVLDIPHARSNPNPGELELYAELAVRRVVTTEPEVKAAAQICFPTAQSIDSEFMSSEGIELFLDSMINKEDDIDDGLELKACCQQLHEILVVNVVIPEDNYVSDATQAIDKLRQKFTKLECDHNGWCDLRRNLAPTSAFLVERKAKRKFCSLGWFLYLEAPGHDDGVAFTDDTSIPCIVAVHTAASLAAEEQLRSCLAEFNKARTLKDREQQMESMRSIRKSVPTPNGAAALRLPESNRSNEIPLDMEKLKKQLEIEISEDAPGCIRPCFGCFGGPVGTVEACLCTVPRDKKDVVREAIQEYKNL